MEQYRLGKQAVQQLQRLVRLDIQRVQNRSVRDRTSGGVVGTMSYIARAPAGGIDARSGLVPGTAEVTVYGIETSGNLGVQYDQAGNPVTVTATNISQSAVAGDAFIYVNKESKTGAWVVVVEDCGVGT